MVPAEPPLQHFVQAALPLVPVAGVHGFRASASEKSEKTCYLLAVAQRFLGFPMQEVETFGWMCINCPRTLGSRKWNTTNLLKTRRKKSDSCNWYETSVHWPLPCYIHV